MFSSSRYDTHSHRLADYPAPGHPKEIFPGQDYSNPRIKDFTNGMQSKGLGVPQFLVADYKMVVIQLSSIISP